MKIRGISVVQPSNGVPMHFMVSYEDGSCERRDIHPIHALRLLADLANGAAFILGQKKED